MNRILKNTFTVGGFTALSRVLGLVREMLQSRLIGAGVEQSAFALAFALPNMARKLFGEGALTAAFVPIFKGEVEKGNKEEALALARMVMTSILFLLGAVVALGVVSLSVYLETASSVSPRTSLTVSLVRILLPYMIFICAAAFGMGTLNSLGRFAEGAFMPAMLNIVWIAALAGLWFFPSFPVSMRIRAVCWAILAGGALQMLFLMRCMAKRGYAFRFRLPDFKNPSLRLVWKNTFLGAVGAGAVQINYMLDQVLGQCAAPWAAGVIGYAERLMDLPLGVVGVAFGTVLLPTFSGHFARGDEAGARKALKTSVIQMLVLMLPASIVTFFCAEWIVSIIYEGRAFDQMATLRVSRALAVYGLGLCFFSLHKCLVPYFQAQRDMKTPLKVTFATVVLNAVLNILSVCFLPKEWRHVGLAGSTVFCSMTGCLLFVLAFIRKIRYNTRQNFHS